MRRLYLIRHAKAGERWTEDDLFRPLSAAGRKQASALELPAGITFLSSPAVRCVETLTERAGGSGIEEVSWLGEGSVDALSWLMKRPEEVIAACTHGDVIWGILEWMARGGVQLGPRPDAPKASAWILDWADNSAEGVPVRATYQPPPG